VLLLGSKMEVTIIEKTEVIVEVAVKTPAKKSSKPSPKSSTNKTPSKSPSNSKSGYGSKQVSRRPLLISSNSQSDSKSSWIRPDESKYPSIPSDDAGRQFHVIMKTFVEDDSAHQHVFPSSLTSDDRKSVHELAEGFGLDHVSQGSNNDRVIVVRKIKKSQEEWQFNGGYIGLFGPNVDAAGANDVESVSAAQINQRVKRDGNVNHITLMIKNEINQAIGSSLDKIKASISDPSSASWSATDWILEYIARNVTDDWIDLGLGCLKEKNNEAWFKVIRWKSADDCRTFMGLPKKDFHLTVGFLVTDIHDQSKGEHTLLPEYLMKRLNIG